MTGLLAFRGEFEAALLVTGIGQRSVLADNLTVNNYYGNRLLKTTLREKRNIDP
jgi:hypothetical protein